MTKRVGINSDTILVFDLDGTLVETNHANFLAYEKAIRLAAEADVPVHFDYAERFNRNTLKRAFPRLTETVMEKIIREKEKCFDEFLPETRLNRNVAEILCRYCGTNPTVLVTDCRRARALAVLDYHSLTDKFSNLLFHKSEDRHTDKFRYAISVLGISPERLIAFENDRDEIKKAIRAGIRHINPTLL